MAERKERVYGGVSAQQRREQRRAALIDAGLELFGTEGYPNVSVKRICDEAGLTQRYFYESFSDREDLLAAVYSACVDQLRNASTAAALDYLQDVPGVAEGAPVPADHIPGLARTTFGAFIGDLAEDTRRARVILIEVVGISPKLEQLRLGAIHDWATMILSFTPRRDDPPATDRLAAVGVVGAITQLLVDWQMAAVSPISEDAGPDLFTTSAIHDVITEMMVGTYDRIFRA